MTGERPDPDNSREDERRDDMHTVEGDGFVMTDLDDADAASDRGEDEDEEEVDPEAPTYGAPELR
jgi:hypothetical protein